MFINLEAFLEVNFYASEVSIHDGPVHSCRVGCLKKSKSLKISLLFKVGMGIAITKTHTKFEDLIFKIGKVPAILRFDQFYKGNSLKMTIFCHIFLFWP